MEYDEQQIIGLIHKMRTAEVHEAQQKLMSMVNSTQFMGKIFNVIQNNQLDPWVKTIAATFLNRVISQKMQEFGYKNMFSAISNIMSSYNILPSDKRCFERSLISLIEYIQEPEEIDEWRNFILKHIKDPLLFDTGLLLISCTAIAQIQTDYLCIIVEETFELTLKSIEISLERAMIVNELIKNWIVVFDRLRTIIEQQNNNEAVQQLMRKICGSEILAKVLFSLYEFNSPREIWVCIDPELYELNLMKNEAAQLNRKVAQYAIQSKIPASNCPCIQLIVSSYTLIKNTIAVVGASQNLLMLDNYQCDDFITSLLGLLVIYVKAINEHLEEEMNILQHIVCFPFIRTRDQEMEIFEESPEEFNTLAEDFCDKQTFGILKTEAAKLLETIADYCRPAMEKSIMFCVECIKMRMGYIPKYESAEVKILDMESAFQILALYSFSLQQYPTHLEALKVILCDKRMMKMSQIEISKVFLFLAYNYGEIFKNPYDGSFWIEFALGYTAHPTTRYMGLDFISNIVDEYFTQNFFNEIVKFIIEGLPRESGQIWNIVRKVFQAQMKNISEALCLNLVNTVFTRIEREIKEIQNQQKQETINLINALHMLRKIIEEKEYINGKQALKARIFDIMIIFNKAVVLNLEDEIIKILIEYIKLDEEATKQKMYQYLPVILDQFKKQEYHEKPYFILLNEIIVKSKFQAVKPILKTLLTGLMFHLFDMSQNSKKSQIKLSIANILTLLQNLLSIHGFEMSEGPDEYFCQIAAMSMRLFPANEEQKIFNKILLAKALNLMLICHLYSKTQNTIDYLIKYARQNIFHKYDAYVLIKLISKALFAEENITVFIEYLNLMIDIANEQEQNEKKGSTTKSAKGRLKIKRDDEMNDLLFRITSPFIDFEYKKSNKTFPIKRQVIECINKMRSNNLETYKLIIMNMNEQQKAKLTKIVNETVEVEGKKRLIRKVIGVRSKNDEGSTEQILRNQNSDLEENDDDEKGNFKRQRVLQKKKQEKKKRSSKIPVE